MTSKSLSRIILNSAVAATLLFAGSTSVGQARADSTPLLPGQSTDANADHSFGQSGAPYRLVKRTDADRVLIQQVASSLQPYSGIKVDAENGMVMLSGNVNSTQDRDAAIQTAKGVSGVKEVFIRLNVKGDTSGGEL